MKRVIVMSLLLSLCLPAANALAAPGTLTAKEFSPDQGKSAPKGLKWIACFLKRADSDIGAKTIVAGPFLVPELVGEWNDYDGKRAQINEYSRAFSEEYRRERSNEFGFFDRRDLASQGGCVIGEDSGDSYRIWGSENRQMSTYKTNFVPSFAL